MIKSFVKGRPAVFIDASNIYFSQRAWKWQVDFVRLMKYLKKETNLWEIFFYTAYDPAHTKQRIHLAVGAANRPFSSAVLWNIFEFKEYICYLVCVCCRPTGPASVWVDAVFTTVCETGAP